MMSLLQIWTAGLFLVYYIYIFITINYYIIYIYLYIYIFRKRESSSLVNQKSTIQEKGGKRLSILDRMNQTVGNVDPAAMN